MKYIFLTFTIDRVTGAQRYVNSKVKWLKEQGCDVLVFDHHGGLDIKEEVVLDSLKPFKNNRFYELFFPPAYFLDKKRQEIIDAICKIIGPSDDYVVESNSGRLALWGELLSQRLHAKHLLLFVGEHPDIRSEKEYLYYSFKFDRNELLLISAKIAKTLFVGYRTINDDEAENHRFAATMNVFPQVVPMPELDNLPNADYKLLSFGRHKNYFDNMFKGVCEFADKHKDKHFNFIILGVESLPKSLTRMLDSCSNIYYRLFPLMLIIPKAIFEYSDVVIATAGCANISYFEGAKTISMNVKTCQPLGVLGYTTINTVTDNNNEGNDCSLPVLLEEVLVENKYQGDYWLERKSSRRGYPFQMSLINDDRQYWTDVNKIVQDPPLRRYTVIFLLRMLGIRCLVRLFNLFKK